MTDNSKDQDTTLHIHSGVNLQGTPFVHLEWQGVTGQITPDEARAHGQRCFEVAEAAVYDAIVAAWLRDKFDCTIHQAAMIMVDFRRYRADTDTSPHTPDE